MKFSILQQDLLPALHQVGRSVGIRPTLPVLANILLSAEDNRVKISATNLEIGIIKYLNVEVSEPGDITVPAKTLIEIISALPQEKIQLESQGEILHVSAGKFKGSVNGISPQEFPAIPLSEGEGVTFDSQVISTSSQISFAAAVDEGRPILTGILTEAKKGQLDLVATDGFRLAHRKTTLKDSNFDFKSLIPKKTYEEVVRIISEEGVEQLQISTSQNQNQVVFTMGQTILSSRLIEGQYPVWDKIIPTQITARVVVDKDVLIKAVKLAAIFAKSEANVISMKTSQGKLTLSSEAKELGSQENEVESEVEGENLQIAFNSKYLLDALNASQASQLILEFSGPLSATLIRPMGIEGLEYIIMPIRLS